MSGTIDRAALLWEDESHKLSIFHALVGLLLCVACGTAQAETLGLSAPLSGPSAILGEQIKAGASAAATTLGVDLDVQDDACTAEGGRAAADRFISAKVVAVVGYLCNEAVEAALPLLTQAGIPVITSSVRTNSLTDQRAKTNWFFYRTGPRADSERYAAASILTRLWRKELFAVIDDGTIYGRELAETFRTAAEGAALKPVFVDTFRPQMENQIALMGRLRKAGATHLFVGGDREDIAVMGRDAAKLGMDLTIAGGEALRAAPAEPKLADGTLMIAMPEWRDVADLAAIEAIQKQGAAAEGYALPTYASVQVAVEAMRSAATSDRSLVQALDEGTFSTVLGKMTFNENGDLATNPYRIFRFEDGHFRPLETE